jgi:carboxypeptidase T
MKRYLTLAFLLSLFFQGLFAQDFRESDRKLYRIYTEDFSRIRNIESRGMTVYNANPGHWIDVMALPEQIQRLDIPGSRVEYLAGSFSELYGGLMRMKTTPGFHDYQATLDDLVAAAAAHPDITQLDTIGLSVGGRALLCLKISDHPALDEDETPVMILGNHHGNEVHSVEVALAVMHYLLDNYGLDPEVTAWVDGMEFWFVPMVNPDGREAMRRTNDHDVDLNRNYSFGFTPGGSHGPEAFSEPETRAIRDLAARYPPVMSLTYHTSAQYVLYPWTHTDDAAPDSTAFTYLGGLVSSAITCPSGGIDGHYELVQGGRWYFTAGEYCDYMYVTHNTLAYTVELGLSQSPDYSVVPEMIDSNLKGFRTLLRQAGKAGVTGRVTDAVDGKPIVADIDIPSIDRQGKIPVRLTDTLFGRYYRYLAPGEYTFEVSAPGYRTVIREITISPDSLVHWDLKLDRSADLHVEGVVIADGNSGSTSGNGDGNVNPAETIGIRFRLANLQDTGSEGVYARIASGNPLVEILSDSLYFGAVGGHGSVMTGDTALLRVDPACPDGQDVELSVSVFDTGGFGWQETVHLDVHAPVLDLAEIRIDDSAGNGNRVFDNGETAGVDLTVVNTGRQSIHGIGAVLLTHDTLFRILSDVAPPDSIGAGRSATFHFLASLGEEAPVAHFASFSLGINSMEGYSAVLPFRLDNILGFFDDFESAAGGWVHGSYKTTANDHDDWQLGHPAGKSTDPADPYSGDNCWGTDMGWDSYAGSSWDGNYQANVYNYLSSPMINCSKWNDVGLRFRRWLDIRPNDYARIKVNGQLVWESPKLGMMDSEWTLQQIDISSVADHNPMVTVTFELQSGSSGTAGGWNIDDVIVGNGLASGASSVHERDILAGGGGPEIWPNPLSEAAVIRFSIDAESKVRLDILDLMGSRVRMLADSRMPAGLHHVRWAGEDSDGRRVAPGVYLVRLQAGNGVRVSRVVVVR